MWEMIVVALSVVGLVAGWFNLNNNREAAVIVRIYNNNKIQHFGYATNVLFIVGAVYFGWLYYASFLLVSMPADFFVKRAIFSR